MYEELASVKEIVNLSPQEALRSAQTFLSQQGYRVVQRTEESLTVSRRDEATSEPPSLNLTVVAQPQPQGGVRIRVRGNDREGVQASQAEWKRWADGLPKKEGPQESSGRPVLEQTGENRTPSRRTNEGSSTTEEKRTWETLTGRSVDEPKSATAQASVGWTSEPITYEYKMVQIPPTISVQAAQHKGDEAAQYMESIANAHAEQGWEFYRVDTFSVVIPPGCLAALFGDKGSQNQYYVVTFRRPRGH